MSENTGQVSKKLYNNNNNKNGMENVIEEDQDKLERQKLYF